MWLADWRPCQVRLSSRALSLIRPETPDKPSFVQIRFCRQRTRSGHERLSETGIRTKPYTPKTNGKAERFIKTALNEWAYARAYQTAHQRAEHLPEWTHSYNWHRPHGGIGSQRPISRLGMNGDNLLRLHS